MKSPRLRFGDANYLETLSDPVSTLFLWTEDGSPVFLSFVLDAKEYLACQW